MQNDVEYASKSLMETVVPEVSETINIAGCFQSYSTPMLR